MNSNLVISLQYGSESEGRPRYAFVAESLTMSVWTRSSMYQRNAEHEWIRDLDSARENDFDGILCSLRDLVDKHQCVSLNFKYASTPQIIALTRGQIKLMRKLITKLVEQKAVIDEDVGLLTCIGMQELRDEIRAKNSLAYGSGIDSYAQMYVAKKEYTNEYRNTV